MLYSVYEREELFAAEVVGGGACPIEARHHPALAARVEQEPRWTADLHRLDEVAAYHEAGIQARDLAVQLFGPGGGYAYVRAEVPQGGG
jgi:hypothetical protein